ncbi:MAG: bifunctional metallophosphatase/5'-nucleotidase [Syntrophaceae bacterium]|nr:bifunctional metallophosphatase/5'-nucleotidase [Syntrophaceae bacterium]
MRTKILWIGILLLILLFHMENHLSLATEASLTLIYTSNTLGELEPCSTCPEGGDNGGLPRRAHYLKTVRQEAENLLTIDGGDALVMSYYGQPNERDKARRWAEFVLTLYETLGYHALNIGDTDLGLGVEYLKNLQKNSKILFLSANLKDKKTNKPIFKPYLIKEIEGIKIGILGLITNEIPPNIQKELKNYSIENPTKAAKETINRFMASCDHIVALAHLTPPEIESLAKEVPRLSIIIGGNDRSFIFPKQIHRSIYVQTDAFGAHVGRMNLNLIKGSSEFIDISSKTLIQKKIEETQKKIEDPKYEKDIKGLKDLQAILIEQKKKMPSSEGKNAYENYLILMHPKMESDKEIENLIESSRARLKRPIPY